LARFSPANVRKAATTGRLNDSPTQKDIPEELKKYAVPAVSIAVVRNGKTASLQAVGVKNIKSPDPVTTDTIFEAASLSKPVFAYGVLKLVDEGKLNLDVPLSTYLPKPFIPDPTPPQNHRSPRPQPPHRPPQLAQR
jgi:CubicO group peptidase (beta-lactamase class C family)